MAASFLKWSFLRQVLFVIVALGCHRVCSFTLPTMDCSNTSLLVSCKTFACIEYSVCTYIHGQKDAETNSTLPDTFVSIYNEYGQEGVYEPYPMRIHSLLKRCSPEEWLVIVFVNVARKPTEEIGEKASGVLTSPPPQMAESPPPLLAKGAPPQLPGMDVAESTVVVKNAFIQKCFAYEVKIYAFPDILGNDGLDSVDFESCDGDLPKGAVMKDIEFAVGTMGKVLCLPHEKGCYKKENGRTGVFKATLTVGSDTEEIIAIVNPDSDLKPVSPVTQTISQNEMADLEVDYSLPYEIVWTYDGPPPNQWKGQLKITVDQPGIYQAFSKNARDERLTFRVLKRDCVDGMYGADCDIPCTCADGQGVCDAADGACICTPGFTGADCTTAVAAPVGFGTDGSLLCEKNGVTNPGCKGILFCRRDPFGCSCMKGFGGPRCTEACPTGMYGPNCEFGP